MNTADAPVDAASGQTVPSLVVRGASALGNAHCIEIKVGESVVVGRSRTCDWSLRRLPEYLEGTAVERQAINADLTFSSVSRRHTRISYMTPGMVELENLSGNGTLLDGRLVDRIVLTDCETATHRIQLGPKGVFLELAQAPDTAKQGPTSRA